MGRFDTPWWSLCWFLGHDRMSTRSSHRVCLRCGQKEKRRKLDPVRDRVQAGGAAARA